MEKSLKEVISTKMEKSLEQIRRGGELSEPMG
jgi:hypothetical protein